MDGTSLLRGARHSSFLLVSSKRKFSIELENSIICRVLLSRPSTNIVISTTSSYKKIRADISFYISHQNLLLNMLNIIITAYPHSWGAYTIGPYLFSVFIAEAVLLIGSF